jgi:hypothetical protein
MTSNKKKMIMTKNIKKVTQLGTHKDDHYELEHEKHVMKGRSTTIIYNKN